MTLETNSLTENMGTNDNSNHDTAQDSNEYERNADSNEHNTSDTAGINPTTTRENSDVQNGDLSNNGDNNVGLQSLTNEEVFKYIETKVVENEKLKEEISSLKENIQFYKNNYIDGNECNKRLQDALDSQKQHYEKIIKRKKQDYEGKFQELNQKLSESSKESQNYKKRNEEIQKELGKKKEDISELEKKIIALKEEACTYQAALGAAANYRMSDNDKNHSVQLKKDILALQDAIERYVTNLKGKIEVNIDNVKDLLQHYRCLTKITTEKKPNISLIKAVLQRHVLDIIFDKAGSYFRCSGDMVTLESEILMKTDDLCSKLKAFSETRNGTDTITSTSSIKVRQEARVALSNRGFSEIITGNNQIIEHKFIEFTRHALNDSMNSYRTINDPAKKQSVENMATNIIREAVRIFWFRLSIQEPINTISCVSSGKIDPGIMTGKWEEEDIDNLVVDLCYFPMIGLDLDNPSKRKLYTRAKVFPRYQERSSLLEKGYNSVVKSVKNVMRTKDQSESSTQQERHDSNSEFEASSRTHYKEKDQNKKKRNSA